MSNHVRIDRFCILDLVQVVSDIGIQTDLVRHGQCRAVRHKVSEIVRGESLSHFHIFPSKFCSSSMQMHDFHLSVLYLYALHDACYLYHICQSLVAFCIIFVASCNHGTMTVAIAKKSFNQLSMVLLSVVRLGLSSSCRAMHYTGIFTIHVSLLIRQKNRAGNMFQINSNFHALQLPRNPISSKHIKSC